MCSSSAPPLSLFLSTAYRPSLLRRRRNVSIFTSPNPLLNRRRFRNPRLGLSASVVAGRDLDVSWFSPPANDDYGGWAFVESPVHKKEGLPTFVLVGAGTSVAVLLTAIAYFSLSRKGIKFQFISPLNALNGMLISSGTKTNDSKTTDSDASNGDFMVSEATPEHVSNSISETLESAYAEKFERVIIPVAVDSTQQEALAAMKKLKIIEDDVKADELCTRREYARWLVRAYSLLERNPKYRVIPSILLSGSLIDGFDDIGVDDPDFGSIQALAEAGVILSKLSGKNSSSGLDGAKGQGGVYFFPDRFISRQDLINWKAQLNYEFMPGMIEKISTTRVGFMDVRDISSDASPELFMDMLAGDQSILRKVFGQSKRFQPSKPVTKAQAVVTLTSGRMTEAIFTELSRLEAENSSRLVEMEEIRSELLHRGEIQKFWDKKLEEEKTHGFDVERAYLAAIHDLEEEKIVQEKSLSESLKEKAAMDCQRQLLLSLKEEVHEMSVRLECERANYVAEQCNVQDMLRDLQTKQEGLLDSKSILEAEKEALRILRSWVEDEARKSQARAKVLEEVGRRWKWDNQA